MEPRIETLSPKKLVGKSLRMSLADNKTFTLWREFMSAKKLIPNIVGTELYSIQVYDQLPDFHRFDPQLEFTKWATAEVADFRDIPVGMHPIELPAGLYAVFLHRGAAATAPQTFQYIFGIWLPQSAYVVDDRPHFERLDERYKNADPGSEEEIWIPIKRK